MPLILLGMFSSICFMLATLSSNVAFFDHILASMLSPPAPRFLFEYSSVSSPPPAPRFLFELSDDVALSSAAAEWSLSQVVSKCELLAVGGRYEYLRMEYPILDKVSTKKCFS
jgi:hypothetical protein